MAEGPAAAGAPPAGEDREIRQFRDSIAGMPYANTWDLDDFTVSKYMNVRKDGEKDVFRGFNPLYIDNLNRLLGQIGFSAVSEGYGMFNGEALGITRVGNRRAEAMLTTFFLGPSGKTKIAVLYVIGRTPTSVATVPAEINSIRDKVAESLATKEESISAAKLVKSKLNLGKEGTAGLTNRLTEFLGSPTVPKSLFKGGIKSRKTRKHRSRRHKKTRKH